MGYLSFPPLRCCACRWLMWMMKLRCSSERSLRPRWWKTSDQEPQFWQWLPLTGTKVRFRMLFQHCIVRKLEMGTYSTLGTKRQKLNGILIDFNRLLQTKSFMFLNMGLIVHEKTSCTHIFHICFCLMIPQNDKVTSLDSIWACTEKHLYFLSVRIIDEVKEG